MPDFSTWLGESPAGGRTLDFNYWLGNQPVVSESGAVPIDAFLLRAPPSWERVALTVSKPWDEATGLQGHSVRHPLSSTCRYRLEWQSLATNLDNRSVYRFLFTVRQNRVVVPCWPLVVQAAQFDPDTHMSGGLMAFWNDAGPVLVFSGDEAQDVAQSGEYMWCAPALMGWLEPPRINLTDTMLWAFAFALNEDSPVEYALREPPRTWLNGPALASGYTPHVCGLEVLWTPERQLTGPSVSVRRERSKSQRLSDIAYWEQRARLTLEANVQTSSEVALATALRWWRDHGNHASFLLRTGVFIGDLATAASSGETELVLTEPAENLSDCTVLALCEPLGLQDELVRVVSVNGPTVTLAAPLSRDWAAGSPVELVALVRSNSESVTFQCPTPQLSFSEWHFEEVPDEGVAESGETVGQSVGEGPTLAWLYRIVLDKHGFLTPVYLTSHEAALEYGGDTYQPANVEHSELKSALQSRDHVAVLKLRYEETLGLPLPGRAPAVMSVEIYRATLTNANAVASVAQLWSGAVRDYNLNGPFLELSVGGAEEVLKTPAPRRLVQAQCNYTLFDSGCQLNREAWKFTARVVSFTGNQVTLDNWDRSGGLPTGFGFDEYFTFGMLERTSDERLTILGSTALSGGQITLTLSDEPETPFVPMENVAVYPGCDGRFETCKPWDASNPTGKFSNTANFSGFPFVPRETPQFKPPEEEGAPKK